MDERKKIAHHVPVGVVLNGAVAITLLALGD